MLVKSYQALAVLLLCNQIRYKFLATFILAAFAVAIFLCTLELLHDQLPPGE